MSDLPNEEQLAPEQRKNDPPIKPKSGKAVAIYLVILFAAAFFLLLMAFFQQQRANNTVIGNLQNSVNQLQTVDDLREENRQLREQLEEYEDLVDAMRRAGMFTPTEDGSLLFTTPDGEVINISP